MSNYTTLKTTINANIRQNGNQEITGKILNSVLNAMVNTLGEGYQFAGIATMETDPGTPDAKVFYIAKGKGTYTNFGGLEVTEDEVVFLVWDNAWHKVATGIAADAQLKEAVKELTEIAGKVDTKQDIIPDLEAIREGAEKGSTALQKESDPVYLADRPSLLLAIDGKVSKEPGKGLSHNDFTDEEKSKLAGLENYDDTEVRRLIGEKADEADLATVAKTGKYADLVDKPTTLLGYGITDAYTKTKTDELLNAKQNELTLTVKDNGNIVIGNIKGQSKEFMPATPSGDPMHYAYEAVGAVWNGTGADIVKTAPWAELADDDADKTVVHKAGYWYLNGLGDLTNADMRLVYFTPVFNGSYGQGRYYSSNARTVVCSTKANASSISPISLNLFTRNADIEVFGFSFNTNLNVSGEMMYAFAITKIVAILYTIVLSSTKISLDYSPFANAYYLKYVKLKGLNGSVTISNSSLLSCKSILYMIQNEKATSAITITLHADAYARAMANADILAALEAHPNVSLASA